MHIFFLVFSIPRRGSILDSRSDRSTSSKSFQKEIKKKEEKIKKKDDFILEMKRQMDSMKEYLVEQSWIPWWDIKYWPRYATTFDSINTATYGSSDNDTYVSHISTNFSTYTSTFISWLILCRSTISWFVFATSTMIVSFVVFFYCIWT